MSRARAVVPDNGLEGVGAPDTSVFSAPLSSLDNPVAAHIRADAEREQRRINLIASLGAYGILANAVSLPARAGESRGLGFRIGTVAMSIRGFSEADFFQLGVLIGRIFSLGPGAPMDNATRQLLSGMALAHPIPSFVLQES